MDGRLEALKRPLRFKVAVSVSVLDIAALLGCACLGLLAGFLLAPQFMYVAVRAWGPVFGAAFGLATGFHLVAWTRLRRARRDLACRWEPPADPAGQCLAPDGSASR